MYTLQNINPVFEAYRYTYIESIYLLDSGWPSSDEWKPASLHWDIGYSTAGSLFRRALSLFAYSVFTCLALTAECVINFFPSPSPYKTRKICRWRTWKRRVWRRTQNSSSRRRSSCWVCPSTRMTRPSRRSSSRPSKPIVWDCIFFGYPFLRVIIGILLGFVVALLLGKWKRYFGVVIVWQGKGKFCSLQDRISEHEPNLSFCFPLGVEPAWKFLL